MKLISRSLLAVIYVLIWLAHIWRVLRGQDRLQLRRPPNVATYWIARAGQPGTASYFSEDSVAEGGVSKWGITSLLRAFGKLYAPQRQTIERSPSRTASYEKGIPDEIYTLW